MPSLRRRAAKMDSMGSGAIRTTRGIDFCLDLAVVVLGAGTIAVHGALLLDLRRSTVAALWAAFAIGGALLLRHSPTSTPVVEEDRVEPWSAVLAGVLAVVGAVTVRLAVGSSSWWWFFWATTVAALAVGTRRTRRGGPPGRALRPTNSAVAVASVILFAVGLGVASLVTTRPDLDDVYVVNRSVYVENHAGSIPTEDVVFDDRTLPGERAPLRSPAYEVLLGLVAAAVPVQAATVVYLWAAPLFSVLSILAVWRFCRAYACAAPVAAVGTATVFLLLDGSRHAGFGNFSFARMWQGKVVLTAVVVPLLWAYAVRWGRDGSRRHLVLLAAANVAAAGLSSTGLFVAPIATFLVSVGIAIAVRRPMRLLAACVAASYPVALALVNRFADSGLQDAASPNATRALAPWARWALVVGRPAMLFVALALALAWVGTTDRVARVTLAVAPLLFLVMLYGPRLVDPIRMTAPGAVSIVWRTIWVVPVPALVGMLFVAPWAVGLRSRVVGGASAVVVLVAVGVFATTTTPVISATNQASVSLPTWKTGGTPQVAKRLIEEATPGSRVAGPFSVDRVVPLLSADVRAVDPRPGWYARGVDPVPRRLVQRALTKGIIAEEAAALGDALDVLEVHVVALPSRLAADITARVLAERGFVRRGVEGQYLILKRTTPKRGSS